MTGWWTREWKQEWTWVEHATEGSKDRADWEKALDEDKEWDRDETTKKWVWRRPAARLWAHIFLFKRHPRFDLVPMLIGRKGQNMKDITEPTHAKARVRGHGSGHLEVNGRKEAPVPLMLAISTSKTNPEGFTRAIEIAVDRLKVVQSNYKDFCFQHGLHPPDASEPIFAFGEVSKGCEALINEFLVLYSHPEGAKPIKKVTPGGSTPDNRFEDLLADEPESVYDYQEVRPKGRYVAPPSRVHHPSVGPRQSYQNTAKGRVNLMHACCSFDHNWMEGVGAVCRNTIYHQYQNYMTQAQSYDDWHNLAAASWWTANKLAHEHDLVLAAWGTSGNSISADTRDIWNPAYQEQLELKRMMTSSIRKFMSGEDCNL